MPLAQLVLAIAPRWLVAVEGVGYCMQETKAGPCPAPSAKGMRMSKYSFWGENLQAVPTYPVDVGLRGKVVYSPHSYGPSVSNQPYFSGAEGFPANMPDIWHMQWGHISTHPDEAKRAPVLLGEWGGRYDGDDKAWQVSPGTGRWHRKRTARAQGGWEVGRGATSRRATAMGTNPA